ncbi:unnamed protein product [Blepharisma stoltei]|uniref:PX domain-containing protein n=1 Tax=Blepharisma stoltei TaxID=1481888 RepID=A0AAU9IN60_9CILI|nr:unnamed protein product [Blepharisma stoltei]
MEEIKTSQENTQRKSIAISNPLSSSDFRPISNSTAYTDANLSEDYITEISNKNSESVLYLAEPELDNKIGVSVCSFTTKSTLMKKQVFYIIQGHDSSGAYEAHRNYKDFRILRKVLVHNWPGCYIPPVPHKQNISNFSPRSIEKMMKLYNLFISRIASYTYLYESDEFQQFIRSPGAYRKLLLRKQPYLDISKKFNEIFRDYSNETRNEGNEKILNEGKTFFKIGIEALGKFESICKINVDYFESFEAQLTQLMHGINHLSKIYEEQFCSANLEISSREVYSNPFFVLLDWVRWEIIDLKAMIEAVDTKKEIDKYQLETEKKLEAEKTHILKLQTGKKLLSQIFSTNSREKNSQIIESHIDEMQKEVIALSKISSISAAKLANLDLPKFKQLKAQKYEVILRTFAGSSVSEFENMINQIKEIESGLDNK